MCKQCAVEQSSRQRRTGQCTVPVRCDTGLSGATRRQSSNGRLRSNPNGWVTWLTHRTVWCAHRQQPSPTAMWWLRAINTPNHHNHWHPSFSEITFNTRASAFTPRHISKDQTLSKPRIQLKHLVTCERVCSCSFALLFLGLPFFFLILVLK